jgi:transposase-like protein
MTQKNDDAIHQLAQGLFRSKDGAKAFLEVLMNQAMQAEITAHLDAEPHERPLNGGGTER